MTGWAFAEERQRVGSSTRTFIQWKGTDICVDVTCLLCDGSFHFDGDFPYYLQCPHCEAVHELSTAVETQVVPLASVHVPAKMGDPS